MAWKIERIVHNPIQTYVNVVNDDPAAAPTTDYHAADKLARQALGAASLAFKGYATYSGRAVRRYASQNY